MGFQVVDHDSSMITDGKTHTGMDVEYAIERGILYRADTLEELAGLMGVDEATFLKTVDDYNEMTRTFNDPEFGRSSFGPNAPLDNPPFLWHHPAPGAMHITMDGISTDSSHRALDAAGNVVPGLYVVGEAACGGRGVGSLGAGYAVAPINLQRLRTRVTIDQALPSLVGRVKPPDRFLNSNKLSADLSSKGFCRAIPHFHGEKEGTEMDNNGLVSRRGFLAGSAFAGAGALFGLAGCAPADCRIP